MIHFQFIEELPRRRVKKQRKTRLPRPQNPYGKWGRAPKEPTERELDMKAMYVSGETLEGIGKKYDITRERVRQILKKRWGFVSEDGGQVMRSLRNIDERKNKDTQRRNHREAKSLKYWGYSIDEYDEHVANHGTTTNRKSPMAKYNQQKRNANARNIGWNLTFKEWWNIWQDSGKWELRGRGVGYCMARWGDSGDYDKDNVYICTTGENFSHSYLTSPWHKRFAARYNNFRPKTELTTGEQKVVELRKKGITYANISKILKRPMGTILWQAGNAKKKLLRKEAE